MKKHKIIFTSALILTGISMNQQKAHADTTQNVIQDNHQETNNQVVTAKDLTQSDLSQSNAAKSLEQDLNNHVQKTVPTNNSQGTTMNNTTQKTVSMNNSQGTTMNNTTQKTVPMNNSQGTTMNNTTQKTVPMNNSKGTTINNATQKTVPINNSQETSSDNTVQKTVSMNNSQETSLNNATQKTVPMNDSQETSLNNTVQKTTVVNSTQKATSMNDSSEKNSQKQIIDIEKASQSVDAMSHAIDPSLPSGNQEQIENAIKNSHSNVSGLTPSEIQQKEMHDHTNHVMGGWQPKGNSKDNFSGTPYIDLGNDAGRPTANTIDVSDFQGNLTVQDYETLKAYGVKTVVVKSSQFSNYVNEDFHDQYFNAKAAGLNVAVYHYAGFANPEQAVQEADYWASTCEKLGVAKNVALCLDLESQYTMNSQLGQSLSAFWKELDKDGYTNHVLYTYGGYPELSQALGTIDASHVWMAGYPYNPTANDPWYSNDGAWQFNDNGHCPGIGVTFDLTDARNDLFYPIGSNVSSSNSANQSSSSSQSQDNYVQYGTFTPNTTLNIRSEDNTESSILGELQSGQTINYDHVYLNEGYAWAQYQLNGKDAYVAMGVLGGPEYGTRVVSQAHQVNANGHWYLENAQNQKLSGFQNVPGQNKICYYDPNQGDAMVYGEQEINGHWYDFDKNTGAMQTGWQHVDGKDTWYSNDGQRASGLTTIDNKEYYFDTNTGALQRNQMISTNGQTYYFGGDGSMMTNHFQWLPIEPNGQYGMAYFDNQGKMVKNCQDCIGNHWYLFDQYGAYKTGFQEVPGQNKICYYADNGQMQYGEVDVNGHGYLLDQGTGALHEQQGWVMNNGYLYYDLGNGEVYLNGTHSVDGTNYQFGGWGKLLANGQQYLGGHWYLLNNNHVETGWQYLPQGHVYYDPINGWMLYGQQKINGYWYLFDQYDGSMKTGWQYLPQGHVYYDPDNGHMLYGQQKINGYWYLFDQYSGAMKTGWQELPQGKVYYDPDNGHMLYGQQTINGKNYLLDQYDGHVETGFQTITRNGQSIPVFYQSDGSEAFGLTEVRSNTYCYFRTDNGAMVRDTWETLNGHKYYFGQDGGMYTGIHVINGIEYEFNNQGQLVDEVSESYQQNGSFTADTIINVRSSDDVNAPVYGQLHAGDTIYYDYVFINDGYVWARYTLYDGRTAYVAMGVMGGQTFGNRVED